MKKALILYSYFTMEMIVINYYWDNGIHGSSPWKRIKFDKRGIEDIISNLLGFIPLGFACTLTLSGLGGAFVRKAVYVTLFLCVLVSLFIETAQAWMPSGSSSQLDLMCNTAGSVIGIFMAHWVLKKELF